MMGPSVAADILLRSRFVEEFQVVHIDTADRRPLTNLGRIDPTNVFLAASHITRLLAALTVHPGAVVYIPISQTALGFSKDALLIGLAKLFSARIVLHLRGSSFRALFDRSGPAMKGVIRWTLKHTDRMIVLGESLRGIFRGLMPGEKVVVVPNGLDDDFAGERPDGDRLEGRPLRILCLMNLKASKGIFESLRAAGDVSAASAVRFVFAGAWESEADRRAAVRIVSYERLERIVEFPGPVAGREKARLLRESDIFILPSLNEGLPWAILEAMASGLPIVATSVGAIPEAVEDGVNGRLVPPGDPDALAAAILELVRDPALRAAWGRKSREIWRKKFTREHFVRGMIEAVRPLTRDSGA